MPVTLRAPITGMVSAITKQPGENALEGEPLVAINGLVSDRVVGYLRQPYPFDPQVGLPVVMTTRERKPRRVTGEIMQVGSQLEIITNALAFVRQGSLVDAGLPIVIGLPRGIHVRPGEILDLTFRKPRANGNGHPAELLQPASPPAALREQQMAIQ